MKKIYTTETELVWDSTAEALKPKYVKRYLAEVPDDAVSDAKIRFGRIYRNIGSE